jgi:hypothetical protein
MILSLSKEAVLEIFIQREILPQPGLDDSRDHNFVHWAIAHGNLSLLRHLLSCEFDIGPDFWHAGHISTASLNDDIEIACATLDFLTNEQWLDVGSVNSDEETALLSVWQELKYSGSDHAPLLLLEWGADPCYATSSGRYPLLAAIQVKNV